MSLDEAGRRTLFIGLILAFALYGLSFVVAALVEGPVGHWTSIALVLSSIAVLSVWFLAVRGGWRMQKAKNRGERRAQDHLKAEREKRAKLRR